MKLFDQASQYWTNIEKRRAARDRPPIDTWDGMKKELETKYVPLSFNARLMDNWHQYTQGNKYAKEYVENLMNSSTNAVPSIRKVKLKLFLNSESTLDMIYELNY